MKVPSPENRYLLERVEPIWESYRKVFSRELGFPEGLSPEERARWLYLAAPFPLLAHDARPDPHFTYANLAAQRLFEMDFETFLKTPSRLSAEPAHREERARLLEAVRKRGGISDYRGIRISRTGKRFWIEAEVWNLFDGEGRLIGQAARILRHRPA